MKGYIKEILISDNGHREIKVELLEEQEPDWRELIKKQVNITIEDYQ